MKNTLGMALILIALAGLAVWQIRDGALKDARLKAQDTLLREMAGRMERADAVLQDWRRENERIARERRDKRTATEQAAKQDPELREQLALPLHPALRPGGGLLGPGAGQRSAAGPDGAAATHPAP